MLCKRLASVASAVMHLSSMPSFVPACMLPSCWGIQQMTSSVRLRVSPMARCVVALLPAEVQQLTLTLCIRQSHDHRLMLATSRPATGAVCAACWRRHHSRRSNFQTVCRPPALARASAIMAACGAPSCGLQGISDTCRCPRGRRTRSNRDRRCPWNARCGATSLHACTAASPAGGGRSWSPCTWRWSSPT